MSEKTVKLEGWTNTFRPEENEEIRFHRQLLIEIVHGLYHQKKEHLQKTGMPPQPVSLNEIWLEFCSRRAMLKSIGEWPWGWHSKRYCDRRVNECAAAKYASDGKPKIVAVTAGLYSPSYLTKFGKT